MQLKVSKVPISEPELLEIRCHKISDEVNEIISFVKSRQGVLNGIIDGDIYEVAVPDVYYIESVDDRAFIYTADKNYEVNLRIYEMEEMLAKSSFIRIQKGMLLNLMKVKSIKPGLSGRYVALLINNEEVIISRRYFPNFKKTLMGDNHE
ncbi:MAG: LytTR family transcriptional regulator [Lachnospiraceae bacterium]|jgi:DNA-binding LytR/AlgR family response regulator|nr:LytTR family transcriptional regulator [Lachnospiraceae bacterium]